MNSFSAGPGLIELLIDVAIITTPDFLQAQTRAKASRVPADMRTIAVRLKTSYVDHNAFPPSMDVNRNDYVPHDTRLAPLSTPIAYLSSIFHNHFMLSRHEPVPGYEDNTQYRRYSYRLRDRDIVDLQLYHELNGRPISWQLTSHGPDEIIAWHKTPPAGKPLTEQEGLP